MNPIKHLSDEQEKYIVPGLERGLLLLKEFNHHNRTLTAPELARRLALPRSTVFRILVTLEKMGFVVRSGNEYRLGMAILHLGFEYLASLELTEIGQPLLSGLCSLINYPCNLVVRDAQHVIYIAKVTPPSVFSSSVNVGTRLPAHATVFGRILLADLSIDELYHLYPQGKLEKFSNRTPDTVEDLYNLVQKDRLHGYVIGEGYFESAISTIAAPVRDHSNRVVATIGATLPSGYVDQAKKESVARQVRATAEELSRLLNYKPKDGQSNITPLMKEAARHAL